MHVPAQQVVPVAHLWPQLPQLLLLVWRLAQVPEQLCVPVGQGQSPPVHVPVQQSLVALQVPPAATHFADGAVVEFPDGALPVGVEAEAAAEVGSTVEASTGSASEGNMAPATPTARIFSALRRERGVASFRARSSKRSELMLASYTSPSCTSVR